MHCYCQYIWDTKWCPGAVPRSASGDAGAIYDDILGANLIINEPATLSLNSVSGSFTSYPVGIKPVPSFLVNAKMQNQ